MPRFVILEHDHPTLHWDFMLEAGALLLTWRLSAPPTAQHVVNVERIGDHRRAYLDYEGPVSGGRGSVTRWDGGTFDWLENGEERIVVLLRGTRLDGTLQIVRTAEAGWQGRFTE